MADAIEIIKAKLPGQGNIPEQWAAELLAALCADGWRIVRTEPGMDYRDGQGDTWAHVEDEWTPDGAGVAAGPQATPDQDERTAAAIGRRVGTLTTDEMAKAIHAAGLSTLASDTAASAVMAMLLRTTTSQATPQVLWEGETAVHPGASIDRHSVADVILEVPPGTRVRVVAAPTSQEPDDG